MNQPSEIIPSDTQTIPPGATGAMGTITNSPLTNLFNRLRKSEGARRNTRGAFGGGKRRSPRHSGRV
jgi:hypothetical protein